MIHLTVNPPGWSRKVTTAPPGHRAASMLLCLVKACLVFGLEVCRDALAGLAADGKALPAGSAGALWRGGGVAGRPPAGGPCLARGDVRGDQRKLGVLAGGPPPG